MLELHTGDGTTERLSLDLLENYTSAYRVRPDAARGVVWIDVIGGTGHCLSPDQARQMAASLDAAADLVDPP